MITDQSIFSKSQPKEISEGLQNFIDSMVEEIVLEGKPFDTQKKYLKKFFENEGLDYDKLETDITTFIEILDSFKKAFSNLQVKLAKEKGKECYISGDTVDKLIKHSSQQNAVGTSQSQINVNKENKDEDGHKQVNNTRNIIFVLLGIAVIGIICFLLTNSTNEAATNTDTYDSDYIQEESNVAEIEYTPMQTEPDPLGLCPDKNHPHEIDLGIGTKWACCNVGANSPEEFGDYFAWGETISKKEYSWKTYIWANGDNNRLTKYCNNSDLGFNGFIDDKVILDYKDDAATSNWSDGWQMPSTVQFEKLINSCNWEWTQINGVNGQKVTGPNGNSLFLPAAGYYYSTSLEDQGSFGGYWSNMFNTNYSDSAEGLCFRDGNDIRMSSFGGRCVGQNVRPVCR